MKKEEKRGRLDKKVEILSREREEGRDNIAT